MSLDSISNDSLSSEEVIYWILFDRGLFLLVDLRTIGFSIVNWYSASGSLSISEWISSESSSGSEFLSTRDSDS